MKPLIAAVLMAVSTMAFANVTESVTDRGEDNAVSAEPDIRIKSIGSDKHWEIYRETMFVDGRVFNDEMILAPLNRDNMPFYLRTACDVPDDEEYLGFQRGLAGAFPLDANDFDTVTIAGREITTYKAYFNVTNGTAYELNFSTNTGYYGGVYETDYLTVPTEHREAFINYLTETESATVIYKLKGQMERMATHHMSTYRRAKSILDMECKKARL